MANVGYDTLTIEINADSGKASRSITKLSNSLLKLEDTAKNLDWKQLENAKKYLEDIAKISFDNVSKGLQDVVSAFKAMNKEAEKGVKSVGAKAQTKAIDLMTNGTQGFGEQKIDFPTFDLSKIASQTTNFIDFEKMTKQVGEVNEGLSMTEARLRGIGFSTEQIENMMSMGQANRDLQDKIALLQSLGLNAQQAKEALKSVNAETDNGEGDDKGGKESNKSMGKLQKLFNSIKRIALYRLIRRVLQIIAKAIKQGIENIAKFDKEFNKSMSNIKTALTYLKNAIGASFKPIIEMLEPIITGLIMRFAEIFNKIAEIMSAMQGKDVFLKSKLSAEDFARSLQKATLSIDELNVIDRQGGSFEEAKVSDEAKKTANFLQDIMNGIKEIVALVMPLIKTIVGSVKNLVEKLLPKIKPLLNAIKTFLTPIVNLINMLIEDTHEWVEDSLVSAVGAISSILNFLGKIVQDLMPILVPIIKLVGSIINMINIALTNVFKMIEGIFNFLGDFNVLHGLLTGIATILGIIANAIASVFGVMNAVLVVLGDIIRGEWGSVQSDWNDAMSEISSSWTNDFVNSIASTPIAQSYNNVRTPNTNSSGNSQPMETRVNVYIDGEEVAKRVNQYNNNRGTDTFRGGTLRYVK